MSEVGFAATTKAVVVLVTLSGQFPVEHGALSSDKLALVAASKARPRLATADERRLVLLALLGVGFVVLTVVLQVIDS